MALWQRRFRQLELSCREEQHFQHLFCSFKILLRVDLSITVLHEKTHAAATILHYVGPKFDAMQDAVDKMQTMMEALSAGMKIQLERSAPRSSCAFCTFEENRGSHHTARCTRYPDTVSRTVQASRLQLCLRCLKEAHADDCDVKCGSCGLDHNGLLCTHRKPFIPAKRPRF
ncbi:unnamed protein product [Heligmosomoides polygyrus]|uniref:Gag protein n=1 Tax=Heligmosomoides polygyrus TaxID=6339 RepID=A0A183GCW6_HELPZ|nr:unnamed protein product [Heligmosomoides polygyrus]